MVAFQDSAGAKRSWMSSISQAYAASSSFLSCTNPASERMAPYELLSALLAIFVISRVVKFVNGRKVCGFMTTKGCAFPDPSPQRVGYLSGLRCLVSPVSVFGASLPTSRLNPGLNWQWEWRNQGGYYGLTGSMVT